MRTTTAAQFPDLSHCETDVAIAYGSENRLRTPAIEVERLLHEEVVPVCSPAYRRRHGGLRTEGELLSGVLLHGDSALAEQGADWDL